MSTFARVLAAVVLIGLIVAIGVGVYDAGVTAGLAQTVAADPARRSPTIPGRTSGMAGDSGSSASSSGSWGSS